MRRRCGLFIQENGQRLPVGILCPCPDLWLGATADGVIDHEEGITGQADGAGDVLRRDFKWVGAKNQSPLA